MYSLFIIYLFIFNKGFISFITNELHVNDISWNYTRYMCIFTIKSITTSLKQFQHLKFQ